MDPFFIPDSMDGMIVEFNPSSSYPNSVNGPAFSVESVSSNYMEVEDISINGRQGQLLHRPSSAFRGDRYGVLLYDADRGITTIVITYGMSREEVLKVVGSIQY